MDSEQLITRIEKLEQDTKDSDKLIRKQKQTIEKLSRHIESLCTFLQFPTLGSGAPIPMPPSGMGSENVAKTVIALSKFIGVIPPVLNEITPDLRSIFDVRDRKISELECKFPSYYTAEEIDEKLNEFMPAKEIKEKLASIDSKVLSLVSINGKLGLEIKAIKDPKTVIGHVDLMQYCVSDIVITKISGVSIDKPDLDYNPNIPDGRSWAGVFIDEKTLKENGFKPVISPFNRHAVGSTCSMGNGIRQNWFVIDADGGIGIAYNKDSTGLSGLVNEDQTPVYIINTPQKVLD